ncbi:hypothetical protein CCR75_003837 [Bremia lactucae]|uniref:Uncharacterized protein n=1 Tax=Bremia lactucae TaxID=4779 RepID=A0A976IL22_BRELC|nr:hypothetical protein CCR75_003837 [Bremia lactucae]
MHLRSLLSRLEALVVCATFRIFIESTDPGMRGDDICAAQLMPLELIVGRRYSHRINWDIELLRYCKKLDSLALELRITLDGY